MVWRNSKYMSEFNTTKTTQETNERTKGFCCYCSNENNSLTQDQKATSIGKWKTQRVSNCIMFDRGLGVKLTSSLETNHRIQFNSRIFWMKHRNFLSMGPEEHSFFLSNMKILKLPIMRSEYEETYRKYAYSGWKKMYLPGSKNLSDKIGLFIKVTFAWIYSVKTRASLIWWCVWWRIKSIVWYSNDLHKVCAPNNY